MNFSIEHAPRNGTARLVGVWASAGAVVCVVGWLYWRLMDPGMAGFIQDDGAYLVTSKALAEGKGYRLLHMVDEPAQVKHPIGYPLILAAGWLINTHFPDNLALLNAMTLAFGMAALLVIFGYLAFLKDLPAVLSLAVVLLVAASMPAMRFLTSIMSEGPYLFWSFLTLSATEMYRRHRSRGWLLLVILGSAITFHTRLFGLTLLAGLTIWFVLQKHRRDAGIYVGGTLVLAGVPWFVWVQTQRRSLNADNFMQIFPYANYYEEITNYLTDGTYVGRLQAAITHAVARLLEVMFTLVPNARILGPDWLRPPAVAAVYDTLVVVVGYCLVGYFFALLARGVRKVARERAWGGVAPDLWYAVWYVGLMLVWSYAAHQPRFFLMVLPLLWLYFLRPFVPLMLAGRWRGYGWGALLALLVVLGLAASPVAYLGVWHTRTYHFIDTGSMRYPALWSDYQASFAFIQGRLPVDAVVATSNPAVYYLYTGRKGFFLSSEVFQALIRRYSDAAAAELIHQMDRAGVTHLITEPHMVRLVVQSETGPAAQYLLDAYPNRFSGLIRTRDGLVRVYQLLPAEID